MVHQRDIEVKRREEPNQANEAVQSRFIHRADDFLINAENRESYRESVCGVEGSQKPKETLGRRV